MNTKDLDSVLRTVNPREQSTLRGQAMQMKRWVQVDGCKVEFGNICGGFVGGGYRYECDEAIDAFAFGKFLEHRDPENDNMPVAVTDDDLIRFNARLIV